MTPVNGAPDASNGAMSALGSAGGPGALSGVRKAAILLLSLGDQAGIELARQLPEEDLTKIVQEIARMGPVPFELSEMVLQEFCTLLEGAGPVRGGTQFAEKLLVGALGDSAGKVLERFRWSVKTHDPAKVIAMRKLDPLALAAYLQNEQPQMIAVVAANLEPQQAAAVLMALPAGLRADVAGRMAKVEHISPEVLSRIAGLVGQGVQMGAGADRPPSCGVDGVAEILSALGEAVSDEVLASIEQADPAIACGIRKLMFTFEDILSLDQQAMQALLAKVDRKVLTLALKGTSEKVRNHFTQYMSQRGVEMLSGDMEALGPVRIRDVEAARQQVIQTIRQLQSEGAIVTSSEGDKAYVV